MIYNNIVDLFYRIIIQEIFMKFIMEPKGKGTTCLQNLCKKYNIPVIHAHEAMSDIYSCMNYWLIRKKKNK